MYWWKDLTCKLLKHPIYSPTCWEVGWWSEREKRHVHFSLPVCKRCGKVVDHDIGKVYFDYDFVPEKPLELYYKVNPIWILIFLLLVLFTVGMVL